MLKLRWVVLALTLNPLVPAAFQELFASWATPPTAMTAQGRPITGPAGCGMDPNGIACEDGRAPVALPSL
jgi:hypothetical protein